MVFLIAAEKHLQFTNQVFFVAFNESVIQPDKQLSWQILEELPSADMNLRIIDYYRFLPETILPTQRE